MAGRELDGRGGRGVELGRERRSLQAEGVEGRLLVGGPQARRRQDRELRRHAGAVSAEVDAGGGGHALWRRQNRYGDGRGLGVLGPPPEHVGRGGRAALKLVVPTLNLTPEPHDLVGDSVNFRLCFSGAQLLDVSQVRVDLRQRGRGGCQRGEA